MYGDYFANLLQKFGLSGTSYGVYHSESKSEKKNNSGGGALQRYYIDPLKAFTSIPRAVKVLETVGYDICSCSFCNENLEKPTDLLEAGDDHNFLKNHFVCLKYIHKEKVSNENLDTLLSELQENLDKFKEQFNHTKLSKTKNIGHLKKWKVSIEKYNS